ncbi:unnamed protein product [Rhizoctonia solani]|uniref:Uncharacterized protein n=1 Tax=Rhizoctonia solani TaxID=456999 RepID=A0A8H3BR60_9AGAM|nr:unnamed protein product [Rhizoctonia solani]
MALKSQLVATGQRPGMQGVVIPIALALTENALVPNDNQPVFIVDPLVPIENLVPVENLPVPVKNPPVVTENLPTPIENPAPVDVGKPHFPGHFPEGVPVKDVPVITFVEVMGIVPVAETSTLLLSLFSV